MRYYIINYILDLINSLFYVQNKYNNILKIICHLFSTLKYIHIINYNLHNNLYTLLINIILFRRNMDYLRSQLCDFIIKVRITPILY